MNLFTSLADLITKIFQIKTESYQWPSQWFKYSLGMILKKDLTLSNINFKSITLADKLVIFL